MTFERTHSKCRSCPFYEQVKVYGRGEVGKNRLILLGESPGEVETQTKEPFTGPAGNCLNWGLYQAGVQRSQNWVTNVLCCRPPKDNFSHSLSIDAREKCSFGFWEELNYLKKEGMNVILALGKNAFTSLCGPTRDSMAQIRGFIFENKGFIIIPTYHPSFLTRLNYKQRDKVISLKQTWINDIRKAYDISKNGYIPPREDFTLFPDLADLEDFFDFRDKPLLGVDIETTGFNPDYGRIVCVGFAKDAERALCVPFLSQGGKSYWGGDFVKVQDLLNEVFNHYPLMFQNALFDVDFLKGSGYDISYKQVEEDILLLAHAIDPELPHNLNFIGSVYGRTPYWKGVLLNRENRILDMEDEDVRRYNLRDCTILHQVLPEMRKDYAPSEGRDIYRNESLPLLFPVGAMQRNGFAFDRKELTRARKKVSTKLNQTEKHLRDLGNLPKAFNLGSDEDLRYFLFGIVPNKLKKAKRLFEKKKDKIIWNCQNKSCERTRFQTKNGDPPVCPICGERGTPTQSYSDLLDMQEILEGTHPIILPPTGFKGRRTNKTKLTQVDDRGRLSLQIAVSNRLEFLYHIKRPREIHSMEKQKYPILLKWLEVYNEWKKLEKVRSTYLNFPVRDDGRVHTRFLIHGTATGRLSSSSPNLMNIPKRHETGSWIRNCFVAPEGRVLAAADFSNLEARILAYEINDDSLIEFLENGGNLHDRNTKLLFGIDESDPSWDICRHVAKIFWFGRISYGGSDKEVFEQVVVEVPGMGLTFDKFKELTQNLLREMPKYQRWYEETQKTAPMKREVSTFLGRRRFLHGSDKDSIKQTLNHPIQGGAAHVINQPMIRLQQRIETEGLPMKLICQIHDELIFEVEKDSLSKMKKIIHEEMTRPIRYRDRMVSFPIEIETGLRWGSLK